MNDNYLIGLFIIAVIAIRFFLEIWKKNKDDYRNGKFTEFEGE